MQLVIMEDIDTASIKHAVSTGAYQKGAQYAREGAVLHMDWDGEECVLQGTVRGSGGRRYDTVAYFVAEPGEDLEFDLGECDCPVEYNCKHAVALALTAAGGAEPIPTEPAEMWERSLDALLRADRAAANANAAPLAVELSLAGRPGPSGQAMPRLLARLVRPGRTGWVGGGLSWGSLSQPGRYREHPTPQVRLLQELYSLYQSRSNPTSFYSYRDDKTIDLATFSRNLWSVLDEAAAVGVQLVHARTDLGVIHRYVDAELCLDVTGGQEPGSLTVTPVLRADGATDLVPVRFIGADGHGVACTTGTEWRVRLARMARPVPPVLQSMTLEARSLTIPADQRTRFRDEFFPRLRHLATIISSDEAFTPPAISEPTLVLRAAYGPGHDLSLGWEWAYQVGDAELRAPLGDPGDDDGYRDTAAERGLLDRLDVPLDRLGPGGSGTTLTGLDTMRFTTEVLPLLADAPGVAVETSGEPADYREAGDSLRIGVSTHAMSGETDWFDLAVSISVEGRDVPFADVFTALARDEPHLLLADGAFFSLRKPELQALRALIEEARALQDAPEDTLRISRFQAGLWEELAALGVVDRQAKLWRQQVTGLLALSSVPAPEPPATLTATLRPYQRDGFGWLAFLWRSGLGGILADDMGLGKTVQSLALICHARQQADPDSGPFLIVAPTSVVHNWSAEAARFAPDLRVVTIGDTCRRRGQDLHEVIVGADVVVTSYTLFRLEFESYGATSWAGLILDEAQYVKNYQSKIHQCARRLTAPFKLAITGTAMENNLMELWSLLSITAPGLFPSPTRFRENYARPIERRSDGEVLGRLRRRIKPLVLRRTKDRVATDLPEKQEQTLEVELAPRHRTVYQRHLQRERQKVLGLIDDVNRNRFTILRSLTLLRQLSLHAGLVDEAHRDLASSKADALLEQLTDVVAGGHRALVFSQFTRYLTHVRQRLDDAGIEYCYLDGNTRKRAEVVRRFKDGSAPVFLISLKAGGFGLNLTEADYCFLLDPWWNPATEAQAVDRTHRIGQRRNVMVYRLIAKDTIEEKVMALKNRKAALFSGVMDDGDVFGSGLDVADIRELVA